MILSGKQIFEMNIIEPFVPRTQLYRMSYGVSYAGYDIRIKNILVLNPNTYPFALGITIEKFNMPKNILGVVHDKSSWARQGLSVFNTIIEPGWKGFLTLELVNHSFRTIYINEGHPIAQVIFHRVDDATEGYEGKYQDAPQIPQKAILG